MFTLQTALKNYHDGKNVVIPNNAESENEYPFKMVVSSYNNSIVYNILFKVVSMNDKNENTGGGNSYYPTAPDISDEPTQQSYTISWRIEGNENNLLMSEVISPETAVANETVQFAVSLIGDYKSEVTNITVFLNGRFYTNIAVGENDGASNYYNTFSFVMPAGNVEIVVTIKAIVVSEYRNISYDTLGYGSYDSVNVYCADVAKPGDYIMCSIYLAYDVESELEITRVVLQNADTGDDICELQQFNEFYDFTMPNCNVVIMIYLMPV